MKNEGKTGIRSKQTAQAVTGREYSFSVLCNVVEINQCNVVWLSTQLEVAQLNAHNTIQHTAELSHYARNIFNYW